jgi:hypothetical protein
MDTMGAGDPVRKPGTFVNARGDVCHVRIQNPACDRRTDKAANGLSGLRNLAVQATETSGASSTRLRPCRFAS